MPRLSLPSSSLSPGRGPVNISYRDEGEARGGLPLVLLHGGWGYGINPFDRQIEKLCEDRRVVAPDRSGYGGSTRLKNDLSSDFHYSAAAETLSVLDSLSVERAFFWGHSDGAVIAAIIGFTAPDRVAGLILEAFHFYRMKLASRQLFETLAYAPETLGIELRERFAREFGPEHWRKLISGHAKAWLEMAAQSLNPTDDLFHRRLHEITAPTMFIHGELDPRTEPGELDAVSKELPNAEMRILTGAGHSPHCENASADLATQIASEFMKKTEARA